MRIREGDVVEVIAGNWIGERGKVQRVSRGRKGKGQRVGQWDPNRTRVVIEGVNLIVKHQRPTGQIRTQTGRIQLEAPIHISNVALVCPHCDRPTRVGTMMSADGKRVRMCKKCGQAIDE